MVDDDAPAELFPASVGERLRTLREAAGLDLNDIGTRTRVPSRHLAAIERGDYSALPSPTYAVGFTKAYARALGADENEFSRALRDEIGREQPGPRVPLAYEPADPARVAPKLLAWTAALLAIALAVVYGVWRSGYFDPAAPALVQDTPTVTDLTAAPASGPPAAPASVASATGQVVLTATSPVWIRVTDTSGAKLFEKEMAAGERYEVPRDAADPQIRTGRANAIQVTVDGREVAPLGPPETLVTKVGVSAAALAARPPVPAPPVAAPLAPAQ